MVGTQLTAGCQDPHAPHPLGSCNPARRQGVSAKATWQMEHSACTLELFEGGERSPPPSLPWSRPPLATPRVPLLVSLPLPTAHVSFSYCSCCEISKIQKQITIFTSLKPSMASYFSPDKARTPWAKLCIRPSLTSVASVILPTLHPAQPAREAPPGFYFLSYFLNFTQTTSSPWNPLSSPLHWLMPNYLQAPAYEPLPPESLPGLLHLHPPRLCQLPLLGSLCALHIHHQSTYPPIFCLFSCPSLLSGTLSGHNHG